MNIDEALKYIHGVSWLTTIPGLERAVHALELPAPLGKKVAVLGGGLVGCETALSLAREGHQVLILEMGAQIAPEANWMHREGMMQAFEEAGVAFRTGMTVTSVEEQGVWCGEEWIPADSVVYALGMRPNTGEMQALWEICPDTRVVGDCLRPRKARQAMEEGFWAAMGLGL